MYTKIIKLYLRSAREVKGYATLHERSPFLIVRLEQDDSRAEQQSFTEYGRYALTMMGQFLI